MRVFEVLRHQPVQQPAAPTAGDTGAALRRHARAFAQPESRRQVAAGNVKLERLGFQVLRVGEVLHVQHAHGHGGRGTHLDGRAHARVDHHVHLRLKGVAGAHAEGWRHNAAGEDGVAVFLTDPADLDLVSRALPAQGFTVLSAKLGYKPKNPVDPASLSAEQLEEVEAFLAAIDAHDDVQHMYVGLGS